MFGLRVLIAEDKDFVTVRLMAQLAELGHRIDGIVRDGRTAVASAWRLQPDLVLLDLHLPPTNGIEAAGEILSRNAVPIILLCGYSAADLIRRAQETGVLAHMTWPADARMLRSVIGLTQARFREFRVLREQAGDLQQALRTRVVVEQAKKLLMRQQQLSEANAFRHMWHQSVSTGTPLREVAARLLAPEKTDVVERVDTALPVPVRRGSPSPTRVA